MSDIHTLLQLDALTALVSVVLIDVALAGDNAIAVGMAAAGLPVAQRRRAIVVGVMAAAVLRILFAIFTVHLLEIIGLLLAGAFSFSGWPGSYGASYAPRRPSRKPKPL